MSEALQTIEPAHCVDRIACEGAALPEERRAGERCEACMRRAMGDAYVAQKRETRARAGQSTALGFYGVAFVGVRKRGERS
jgi:hypothetical protein